MDPSALCLRVFFCAGNYDQAMANVLQRGK